MRLLSSPKWPPSMLYAGICFIAVSAHAQTPDAADPIRCWWRTNNGAVAIGEPFDATLTCAVRDQESVRTLPDESRLTASTVQLSPFDVLGGSHPADLRSPTHRFFQYHYTLRIIDRDAIGRDATFPDLQIGYRVHTKINGEWVEGRDRTYVMPGRPVRVLSLVPAAADDIRDSSDEDFARIDFGSPSWLPPRLWWSRRPDPRREPPCHGARDSTSSSCRTHRHR